MDVSGILIVNKPAGLSSHGVVNRIRRIFGTKTVGHCGTLDPMATGVLPILIGRAVKASEFLKDHDKSYIAGVSLGITTDSYDTTGSVVTRFEGILPTFTEFEKAAKEFEGSFMQLPPMYSALKVKGVKLVNLARQGVEIERTPREVTVSRLVPYEKDGVFYIDADCSRGTYIRTLCYDIGEKLGCGAAMSSLCRTRVGSFDIKNSYTLEQLSEMNEDDLSACLLPIDSLFMDLPRIFLPKFYAGLYKNGCEIYFKKLRPAGIDRDAVGVLYRVYDEQGFVALGESAAYTKGVALKSRKMFFN